MSGYTDFSGKRTMDNELLFWAAVFAGAAASTLIALAYITLGPWLMVFFDCKKKK